MRIMDAKIIDLSFGDVGLAYGLVGLTFIFLIGFRLDVMRDIYYSVLRMSVQLFAIGFVLAALFRLDHGGVILLTVTVMWLAATWIAVRPARPLRRQFYPLAALALLLGSGFCILVITQVVIRLKPWYNPRYFIPLAGMILANGMNGVSLAIDRLKGEFKYSEAAGGNIDEVLARSIRAAVSTAVLPMTNTMMAVGLVAIPGMMTGQILSGTSPLIAAKYQLMVMCMLFASVGIATSLYVRLAARKHFDLRHQQD